MRVKLISSDGSTIIEVDDSQVEYLKVKGGMKKVKLLVPVNKNNLRKEIKLCHIVEKTA